MKLLYECSQEQRAYSFCGTIEYMAPEVVRGGSAGHDIVSNHILLNLFMTEDANRWVKARISQRDAFIYLSFC